MTPEHFFAAERKRPAPAGPCTATADRWVQSRTGISPIAAGGLTVEVKEDADTHLARAPLPRLMARCMRAAGFAMTKTPGPGDIGAIIASGKIVCAVRGERMWLYRSDDGFAAAPLDVRLIAAWGIA